MSTTAHVLPVQLGRFVQTPPAPQLNVPDIDSSKVSFPVESYNVNPVEQVTVNEEPSGESVDGVTD